MTIKIDGKNFEFTESEISDIMAGVKARLKEETKDNTLSGEEMGIAMLREFFRLTHEAATKKVPL